MPPGSEKVPWAARFNPGALAGLTLSGWWRLLRQNRFDVDAEYWPRLLSISFLSVGNSLMAPVERLVCGSRIERAVIRPPLFILGTWRSGTTHLHNLLSRDPRYAYPTFYQVRFPRVFLLTEALAGRLAGRLLPRRRAQDDMRMGFGEPAEDEMATAVLTLRSNLLRAIFPRRSDHYALYETLRDVPPEEVEEWKKALLHFLRKLTCKYGRPLVLKSPDHIGRIRFLVEMFPGAKYVHVHRHPYEVYQSSLKTMDALARHRALQRYPDAPGTVERFAYHRRLYDLFFAERGLIPSGHLAETSFGELVRDPMGTVERIYRELDLGGFERMEPVLRRYVDSLAGYRRNVHAEVPAEIRRDIATVCRTHMREYGYRE